MLRQSRRSARVLTSPLALGAILSFAAAFPLPLPLPLPAQGGGTTTVILVRHAEKATVPANDPVLDSAGQRRAKALAVVLRDSRVDRILVTQYQRTRLTAEAVARAAGITPHVIDTRAGGAAHARAVADAARAEVGRTVLVVGHSNTIPAIVRALGGSAGAMADEDYDDLFVVIIPPSGAVRTIHARYGARAHSAAAAASR
jgi:phosphohistidine phosphatase SixA